VIPGKIASLRNRPHFPQGDFVAICMAVATALAEQPTAITKPYPTKPIRLITAATPSSGPKVIARHLAAKLTEAWGQQVVVDPRPGATGMISGDLVAKSAPDGYALWFATSTQLLGSMMFQRNWMVKEYAPIGMLSSTAFAIAVNCCVPAHMLAGYEVLGWHGLLAPLNTPKDIIAKVNATATKAVLSADMQERMLPLGVEPAPSTPAEFVARLQAETAKLAKLMKDANIRPME
jgi:tripartite-type tricarboxylate transporter receptor subunit TctC